MQPLLGGADAVEACRIADDIGRALVRFVEGPLPSHTNQTLDPAVLAAQDAALARGRAGMALLLGALGRAIPATQHATVARQLLASATRAVADVPMTAALFGGVTGIAWVLGEVAPTDPGDDDPLASVDDLVLAHVALRPWLQRWDLLSGLVGMGVYAVERLPRPAARAALVAIIDRLEELSERRDGGPTWHTPPRFLPSDQKRLAPDGYYNLGLAHGVPGVIGFLGIALEHGIAPGRTRAMLEGAVRWLLAQPRPMGGQQRFGSWVTPAGEVRGSRMGWCYGDPGVAVALLGAARRAGEPEWEAAALAVARDTLECTDTGVVDAPLCHGAAGLMHMYSLLYRATAEAAFANAASRWYRSMLAMRRDPAVGITGIVSQEGAELACPGFLCGAAGVGLALLAAATAHESGWERLLMLSVPPRLSQQGPADQS